MAKWMKVTAALAAAGMALAGCSSGGGDTNAQGPKDGAGEVRVWFMEGSISDDAQQYLIDEFAKEVPGGKLTIEIQPWDGIKPKLQTSLASKDQSPDLVELGSAKDPLINAGAFTDITDMKDQLGAKDFIPAFMEGGVSEKDGKQYSLPLYGGVRGVFYRKDLFDKAGLKPAETLEQLKENAIKLQEANPDHTPDFSGIYLAGVDFHALESYMFASGGRYAEKNGDKWEGTLSKPEAQKGLKDVQEIFQKGTRLALDSAAAQKSFQNYFNEGRVGMLIATGNIGNKIDQKLWDEDKVGISAIPSNTPGKAGVSYAGGSNIAISRNSKNPVGSKKALVIIFSEQFQTKLAESGWVPGNLKYADKISGPFAGISREVMLAAHPGPMTTNWGKMYSNNSVADFWARLAKMEDPAKLAQDMDAMINSVLNSEN